MKHVMLNLVIFYVNTIPKLSSLLRKRTCLGIKHDGNDIVF